MPFMSFSKYSAEENLIRSSIMDLAWKTMEEAGKRELEIAVANGDVDENGYGKCAVIADGQWARRSYRGSGFVSLSGWVCHLLH